MKFGTLLDDIDYFAFHLLVDFSVAGESTAAGGVARQFAYEGLVLEGTVDVAREGSSCHVAACHFVDGTYFLFAGQRVTHYHVACGTCNREDFFDGFVVLLVTDEGQQGFAVGVGIPLDDIQGRFVEGDFQCHGMPSLSLSSDVMYLPVDEVVLG